MFGFSLPKLVFTIVAVLVVWYGFRWFNRLRDGRGASPRPAARKTGRTKARAGQGGAKATEVDIEEMVQCDLCKTFVAAKGTRSCGRDGCPYPG